MKILDFIFCIVCFIVLLVQAVQPISKIKTSKQKNKFTANVNTTKTTILNHSSSNSSTRASLKQQKKNTTQTSKRNTAKTTILNHSNSSLINHPKGQKKNAPITTNLLNQLLASLVNSKVQKKKISATKKTHTSADFTKTKQKTNVSETTTAKTTISNQTHVKPSSNLKDQLKTVSEYDETVYDPSLEKKFGLIKHNIGKKLMTSLSSELSKREYEKEDLEFEQKLQKEQEASKEEEQAFNKTNQVLDRLGMLRSTMNSIVEDPGQDSEPTESNIHHPENNSVGNKTTSTITDNKKHKLMLNLTTEPSEAIKTSKYADTIDNKTTENPFKFLNLELTVEKSNTPATVTQTTNKQQPKKTPQTAEEIYSSIFLNQVKSETRKKEKSGHKDILPVYLPKHQTAETNNWKPSEDNSYHLIKPHDKVKSDSAKNHHNGVLAAEFIDDEKLPKHHKNISDGGLLNHNDGDLTFNKLSSNFTQELHNSTVLHHLTAGVLIPSDIEKASAQFAVSASTNSKPAVRIHLNQVDTRKKMFFTKSSSLAQDNHKTNNMTTTATKSKVTVFGADDIDIETSTPNFAEHIINEINSKNLGVQEYASKEKPTAKESDDIDRLKTMEAELKTTRAKLHVRGFIPRKKDKQILDSF